MKGIKMMDEPIITKEELETLKNKTKIDNVQKNIEIPYESVVFFFKCPKCENSYYTDSQGTRFTTKRMDKSLT